MCNNTKFICKNLLYFLGLYMTGKQIRKYILPKTAAFQEKYKLFKEVLCASHPPVFHEWFLRTFPDPTSWYSFLSNSLLAWVLFYCYCSIIIWSLFCFSVWFYLLTSSSCQLNLPHTCVTSFAHSVVVRLKNIKRASELHFILYSCSNSCKPLTHASPLVSL